MAASCLMNMRMKLLRTGGSIIRQGGRYCNSRSAVHCFKAVSRKVGEPLSSCEGNQKLSGQEEVDPTIVCVDEIQDIKKDSRLAEFIRDLHTQECLPILLVCAGLSNSQIVLDEVAISRPNSRHVRAIGRLTAEETLEVTEKSIEVIANRAKLAVKPLIERYAKDISGASDQWPRHLTCYLHGLCEALIAHTGPSLSTLTIQDVLAYGNNLRKRYYQSRLQASKLPVEDIVRLYERVDMGIRRKQCINFLQEALEASDDSEFKSEFQAGGEVFEQALRSGILTCDELDQCEIPIPSMRTFMVERAQEEREEQAPAERVSHES